MRRFGLVMVLLLAGVTVASAQRTMREGPLRDSTGKEIGRASIRDSSGIMHVTARVEGLTPGEHGLHIHQAALCEGPRFESAGPHYNPHNRQHGRRNSRGPHLGDLGNLTVGADGKGSKTVTINDSETRKGLTSFLGDGRAIVVHANADDEMTDPSGNSGARVACAVVK